MAAVNAHRGLSLWACIALSVLIVALAALILLAMGRAPYYRSGPIMLWYGDAWGPQSSQQFTDPYTFTHVTNNSLACVRNGRRKPGSGQLLIERAERERPDDQGDS